MVLIVTVPCHCLSFILVSCQSRVTVMSCFVYRVIRDLQSIDHMIINPIRVSETYLQIIERNTGNWLRSRFHRVCTISNIASIMQ